MSMLFAQNERIPNEWAAMRERVSAEQRVALIIRPDMIKAASQRPSECHARMSIRKDFGERPHMSMKGFFAQDAQKRPGMRMGGALRKRASAKQCGSAHTYPWRFQMNKLTCRTLFTIALSVILTLSPLAAQAAPVREELSHPVSGSGASVDLASRFRPASRISTFSAKTSIPGRIVKSGKKRRFKRPDGTYLRSRWVKVNGKTYYFSKTTYAVTGLSYIGGKVFMFSRSGVLYTKNRTVKGKKLKLNKDHSVYSYGGKRYNINTGKSSKKGQQVADFARRFVGNPYKWGGSSLTHGADCSGFVMAVYAHFNIRLPHYDAWIRKCGRPVPSLAAARPGDVICYNGHVAIYLGNNRIVHAAGDKYGICIGNNAAYTRILSIRRFF